MKYKSIYDLSKELNMVIEKHDSYPNTYTLKNCVGETILNMVNRKYLRYHLNTIIAKNKVDAEWDERFKAYQKYRMAKVKRSQRMYEKNLEVGK